MGTWSVNSAGVWTLTGGGVRTVVTPFYLRPANCALRLQLANAAHGVRALFPTDTLGRNGWEVGFDTTGTGGNIFIRRVDFGVPQSDSASAAHGVTTGDPFTLEVRLTDGKLEARINGDSTPVVQFATGGTYGAYRHFGWVANTNGATVLSAEIVELVPVVAERSEVLVAVCDGNVYASFDGRSISLLASNQCKGSGAVDLQDFEQKVYGLDGATAFIIDPIALTGAKWVTSSGQHLGQTDPGTSRAIGLFTYLGRIAQFGDAQDPQNVQFFAQNDPLAADNFAQNRGRAWILSGQAGKVGQPIVAAMQATNGPAILGCTGSIWRIFGDLATGIPQTVPAAQNVGITGKDAMHMMGDQSIVMHTTQGAAILGASGGGSLKDFSGLVLTKGLELNAEEIPTHRVQVIEDPERQKVYFFLTPEAGGQGLHFAYEIRSGGFSDSRGGFFPMQFPERCEPMAACVWRGRVHWLGRDGYVYHFDDAATSDDGDPIEFRVTTALMETPDATRDTILDQLYITPGKASAPLTAKVYGGNTAEKAFERDPLQFRWGAVTAYPGRLLTKKARAKALIVEISSTSATHRASIEKVEARITSGKALHRADRQAPPTPTLCEPYKPVVSDPNTGDEGPGGGKPPTECTLCPTWLGEQATQTQNYNGTDYTVYHLNQSLPGGSLAHVQFEVFKYRQDIIDANLCDVPTDFGVIVKSAELDGGEALMSVSDFLALAPGEGEPAVWDVYFACELAGLEEE